jgi:uridine kinase
MTAVQKRKKRPSFLIGVAGGTGSGKTTLTRNILEALGGRVAVLQHDWYYRDRAKIPPAERETINYDHPNALETTLLVRHLKALQQGKRIKAPRYNFVTHTRLDAGEELKPTPVIIVEGILIFADRKLSELFDLKIFVQTESDLRLLRRLERDMKERGRSFENSVKQYLETVRPMHDMFVEPSKANADIIVPASTPNEKAIKMIVDMIQRRMDRHG